MSWEAYVRRVTPYTPGEQPSDKKIIKLNTNENPYPPAPGVMEALSSLGTEALRRYPDPSAQILRAELAGYHGVKEEQIFPGVGSDDVLAMIFLTFFGSDRPVLFPDITYSFYEVWADLFHVPYTAVPLDEEFQIRPEDYARENGGVLFPNPNAPTGALLPLKAVRRILDANADSLVVVDEAYIDFGGESALPLIAEYDNLLIVRTFSKSRAMAGMRIGYAAGSGKLIRCLEEVKYSFNSYTLSAAALGAGAASVRDEAYFARMRDKIIATRERIKPRLAALGFTFCDSKANFLFARHKEVPGRELFEMLRARGILVRRFDRPRIGDYLRISIGTDEQMDRLAACLGEYLAERKAL